MTAPGYIGLPQAVPAVSSWQLVDWLDQSFTSTPADSGGVAVATLPQLAYDERWQLTHMVAGCTSTAKTRLRLYLDTIANAALRDGSNSGNFDVADWAMGLMVPPSRSLLAVWSGADVGAIGTLTVQANILRKVG